MSQMKPAGTRCLRILAIALPLAACAFAQAHVYRWCASADDLKNKFNEPAPPYADGNGDGKADDYLMKQITFNDTLLEEWCINGGSNGGYYIAWKVDGKGKPFKFIGKCSWEGGMNNPDWGGVSGPGVTLTHNVTFTSTDPKTGHYWKYTYYPELGSIVAQKYDADGNAIPPGASIYPKSEPFSYNDLPGGGDPNFCVDVDSNPSAGQAPITLPWRQSYAVKFLCGYSDGQKRVPPSEPPVKRGNYATVINVHNPWLTEVVLLKKVVLATPERQANPGKQAAAQNAWWLRPTKRYRESLPSDHALSIDCGDIAGLLAGGGPPAPGAFAEGFLVIDSFSPDGLPADLDVVAVSTTAATVGGTVNDHHVLRVTGRRLPPGIWPY